MLYRMLSVSRRCFTFLHNQYDRKVENVIPRRYGLWHRMLSVPKRDFIFIHSQHDRNVDSIVSLCCVLDATIPCEVLPYCGDFIIARKNLRDDSRVCNHLYVRIISD